MTDRWDFWFMGLARYAATASKDPSTKCGTALVGVDRRNVAIAYNGFPRGIADDERLHDRKTKYKLIMHAERNALDNAQFDVEGSTLYCTLHPCLECAKSIISRRVARVVTGPLPPIEPDRWTAEIPEAQRVLAEAGVRVDVVDAPQSLPSGRDLLMRLDRWRCDPVIRGGERDALLLDATTFIREFCND